MTGESERGRANRRRGHEFERALVRYLLPWFPQARRSVRTGFRTGDRVQADEGDIAGIPGVIVSAKDCARESWPAWWAELDAMLADDPAALGFVVTKRRGHADPADAWAHLCLGDLSGLYLLQVRPERERDRTPVRIRLGDLVELLIAAGYASGAA